MTSDQYIDSHADDFVRELQKACRQPSIAAQNAGMREMADLLASVMRQAGIEVRVLPTAGHPVVVGHVKGKSPRTLLFYNHYDVQPPDPLDEWVAPPFSAGIRDGKIFARGASDNKGNALSRVFAVKSLLESEGELPVTVKFLIEGEEEIGSPNLRPFCLENRDMLRADGGIWESGYRHQDGRLGVYAGVKGDVYLELEAHGANTDLHSAAATTIPNPAWRLCWALASLKNQKEEILVKGFYDDAVAPGEKDVALLERPDPAEQETHLKRLGLKQHLLGLRGMDVVIRTLYSPTCTIAGFLTGYVGEGQKTVLPSKAMAKVDFRLVPDQDPDDIERKIRRHLIDHGFGDISVKSFTHSVPCYTPLDDAIVQTVLKSAETVYKARPSVSPWQAGSGPMSVFVKDLGIPMAAAGVGYWDNRNHGPNENVRIEDYVLGIKMAVQVMRDFAQA